MKSRRKFITFEAMLVLALAGSGCAQMRAASGENHLNQRAPERTTTKFGQSIKVGSVPGDYLQLYSSYMQKDDPKTAEYYLNLGLKKYPGDPRLLEAKTRFDLSLNKKTVASMVNLDDMFTVKEEMQKESPIAFKDEFRMVSNRIAPADNTGLREWFKTINIDVDRYEFVELYINTFGSVVRLNDEINRLVLSKGYAGEALESLGRKLRGAALDIELKSAAWNVFADSKNLLIKENIPLLHQAHTALSIYLEQASMAMNQPAVSTTAQPEALYALNSHIETIFKALILENNVVKAVLLDEKKALSDGPGLLFLTERQRTCLLGNLEEIFGPGIREKNEHQGMLNEQRWGVELYRYISTDGKSAL